MHFQCVSGLKSVVNAISISMLACQVSLALAADQSADQTLGAVVVTASRADTRLEDMPLHTTVISQDDLQRSAADTLDQVLRNVPGLLIPGSPAYVSDPTGQNIKFRGMDKKVLVLVDGIPVHDPFFTTIQWFKVPKSNVERVEIVRGGGSSLWGNMAVGGVINIVTKRPRGNDGEGTFSAGSRNTYSGQLTKNFVVNDLLTLNVTGSGFDSGGYQTQRAEFLGAFWPGRGLSSANASNLRVSAYLNFSPDLTAFLRMGYNGQDEKIGGYMFGSNQQIGPDVQGGFSRRLDARSKIEGNAWAQWVRFDKYNGAGCYTSAVFVCGASAATAATTAQQSSPILQYATSYDAMNYRERGASLMYQADLRGAISSVQAGVDYRMLSGEDAQQTYRVPTAALPGIFRVQRANYGAGRQDFLGLFAQAKWIPVDRLELTLSGRWDRYSSSVGQAIQTNYSNVASPVITSSAGGAVPTLVKTAFDPTISGRFDVSEKLSLRGSAYKAFRAPGLNNMYRTFGSANITVANPSLGPENLVGKEFGFDWSGEDYSFGATLFRVDVKDVVANYTLNPGGALLATGIPQAVQAICGNSIGLGAPLCTGTVSYNTNGQDQRSHGLEVDGKWSVREGLDLQAYYTRTLTFYTNSQTGDPIGKQLQLVPLDVAGGSMTWRPSSAWSFNLELRYNGPMNLALVGGDSAIKQGGYSTLNVGGAWRFAKGSEWFASVTNLSDKRYTDSSASNQQGVTLAMPRTLATGLRLQF